MGRADGIDSQLAADGIARMQVDVLQVNPSRTFYERLGARHVSERDDEWDGVRLTMCTYGADIRALRDG